nr:translation initiation factor IF-2-like [Aegilops tauschii subsp. strangulata]
MASPGSSGTTCSRRTNLFDGPDPVVIRDLNILARVPVVLDHPTSTYYAWKTYFSLVFREYNLRDHIDGSVDSRFMEDDEEWTSIDATLIRWFYTTISKDLFHTVVSADDDTHAVWTKLNGLFTDNALQCKVFLHGEFFGCQQLNSSVDDYCMRLKKLVDELRDLGEKVSDELLLSTFIAGLNDDFENAASNIPLITNPTFPKIVAYLKLQERRMRMSRTRATHTALTAGTCGGAAPTAPVPPPWPAPGPFQAPPPPPEFPYPQPPQAPPPPPAEQQQRRGGRRGRSSHSSSRPPKAGRRATCSSRSRRRPGRDRTPPPPPPPGARDALGVPGPDHAVGIPGGRAAVGLPGGRDASCVPRAPLGVPRGLARGLGGGGLFFVIARRCPGLVAPPDDSL